MGGLQAGRGAGVALENYKERELNRPCTALCAEAVLNGRGRRVGTNPPRVALTAAGVGACVGWAQVREVGSGTDLDPKCKVFGSLIWIFFGCEM